MRKIKAILSCERLECWVILKIIQQEKWRNQIDFLINLHHSFFTSWKAESCMRSFFLHTQFTFMEFAKKRKFLSTEKLWCPTKPIRSSFSRRAPLSFICSSSLTMRLSTPTSSYSQHIILFHLEGSLILFSCRIMAFTSAWNIAKPATQHNTEHRNHCSLDEMTPSRQEETI